MMRPVKFAGYSIDYGKPAGWNEARDGKCAVLPVMTNAERNTFMSVWKLTWRERLAVLFGRNIALFCFGAQIPVMLEVVAVKEASDYPQADVEVAAKR